MFGAVPIMIGRFGSSSDRVVVLVIPDGYSGLFWVIEDSAAPAPGFTQTTGAVTITIPQNGVARTTRIRALDKWHRVEARDYSGNRVTTDTDVDRNPRYSVYGLGGIAVPNHLGKFQGIDVYFVGSFTDYRQQTVGSWEGDLADRLGQGSTLQTGSHDGAAANSAGIGQ
jgi:hypothetical protein